jgi:hypothetical protein
MAIVVGRRLWMTNLAGESSRPAIKDAFEEI